MSIATEDVIGQATRALDSEPLASSQSRAVRASSLAGASPAVPRDPRLLQAEQADYEARQAAADAEAAQAAAQEAVARAAAAKAAAERSKAELATAREEAKAKAEAAALAVRLEHDRANEAAAAARVRRRAVRDEQLGTVHTVETAAEPQVVTVVKNSTDRLSGSLALFLVRLALAAFVAIIGWQSLVDRQATVDALSYVGLDAQTAGAAGWGVSIALLVIAVFLLIGLGPRVFSVILLIGTVGFLVFFRFGNFSPFMEGQFGFYGDRDVLLAVMAAIPVLMGAGRWSVDAYLRRRRQRNKLED